MWDSAASAFPVRSPLPFELVACRGVNITNVVAISQGMSIDSVVLHEEQQLELSRIAQSRSLPAGHVFRARLILMLAEGAWFSTIKQRLRTTAPTIMRWKQRFVAAGLDGLDTIDPGQPASVLPPKLRTRILSATRRQPPLTGVAANSPRRWASVKMPCIASGKRRV